MTTRTKQDMYLEDARSIALEATELVQKRLKEFGIELSPEQEDKVYVPLSEYLDELGNGDFRSHM